MPSTITDPASSPAYNTSFIIQSGEPASENIAAEQISRQKQLNAERCRRYRQKCKRLKSGDSDMSTSRGLVADAEEFQNSSNHIENITDDANRRKFQYSGGNCETQGEDEVVDRIIDVQND
ncbi:hypothetical protein PV325_010991 [Microctonus aethiopoides]|uniref:Uncharacterized protein n=1 Tax=Microctonus aethiopoides TaxID=144406 RepID=A0AA39FW22_9HYME|nr:hypothetical protein PV325_010991 [Microctonus aethiopoides]KAK0078486.1 hypothetical protein PV326_009326 [Microctonus aethiopoides]KAK0176909.1 hypothetical protein PV328_001007 [Microctonus aethiopoides]